MKSTRSSLASRYSVAFILCLSCLMILMASALSVSPNSSLASSTPSTARVGVTATPPTGPIARTLASPPALPPVGQALTATKTDSPGTPANPGDTIMYTVVITSTGTTDATNVSFTDTIDPNTTLLGVVASSPIAFDDTYTASGNIPIAPAAGLLANDIDPDTGTNAGLTVSQVQGAAGNVGNPTNTTATGIGGVNGSVTVLANGTFTYQPPPGFTGDDTFTYQISDASAKTGSGSVKITVSNMVWFIDNTSAATNSRGTFTEPFKTIAAFNAINTGAAPNAQPGHHVVLRPASGNYAEADGINLRDNQTLTGPAVAFSSVFVADANSTSAYTTFAGSTGTAATITTTAGNGVDLASGNFLRGFNIGNTPGFFGVNGTVVGSLTVATVSKTGTGGAMSVSTSGAFGSVVNFGTFESGSSASSNLNLVGVTGTLGVTSGGTGFTGSAAASAAININGGSVSLTYPGNVTKATTGALLSVSNGHTGTLIFNTGTLNASSGTGLQFDNADGTYNFNGTNTLVGGDAGVDILNNSSGTFTFSSTSTITSPTGTAFNVNTGSPTVTYSGNITQNTAAQRVINIDTTTSNTITFQTGTITGGASSTGININAANGNVTFSNGMTLGTSGARMTNQALTITGGSGTYGLGVVSIFTTNVSGIVATNADGTINCSAASVVDSSSATAINIDGPAGLTSLGMALTRVSSGAGTSDGISIQDTTGSFTVNGDGADTSVGGNSTGGIISGKSGSDGSTTSGIGVYLNNVTNITLRRMTINGTNQNYGIKGLTVTNFTLEYSSVTGTNGTAPTLGAPENNGEGCIYFGNTTTTGLTGSGTITSCNISGGRGRNMQVVNSSGTLNRLTITGTTFGLNQAFNDANASLTCEARTGSSPTLNVTVTGCTFTGSPGDAANFTSQTSTTMDVIFGGVTGTRGTAPGNTITNTHPNNVSGGSNLTFSTQGAMTFHCLGNKMRDANGSAVTFFKASAGTSLVGYFDNNEIGDPATVDSGSKTANGIFLSAGGTGVMSFTITNNLVHRIKGNFHLNADNTGGSYGVNLDVRHNTFDSPGSGNAGAIGLTNGSPSSTDSTNVCAVIGGSAAADKNTLSGWAAAQQTIFLGSSGVNNSATHTFTLPGLGASTEAAVESFVAGNNIMGGSVVDAYVDAPATFAAFKGTGTSCAGTPGSIAPPDVSANSVGPISDQPDESQFPSTESELRAARGEGPYAEDLQKLKQEDLNWMVQAALGRWVETGLSAEDLARLQGVTFEVADLPDSELASMSGSRVQIDDTAAGYGWFFDQSPAEDGEFQVLVPDKELQTGYLSIARGKVDLLTVVMRQLGEAYLQGKDRLPKQVRKNLAPMMEPTFSPGVRRLPLNQFRVTPPSTVGLTRPAAGERVQAEATAATETGTPVDDNVSSGDRGSAIVPRYAVLSPAADRGLSGADLRPAPAMITIKNGGGAGSSRANRAMRVGSAKPVSGPMSGETVTVNGSGTGFTLPVGKSVTIMFSVTVNAANTFPPGTTQICNQGFVQATGIASFGTTDPGPPVVNGPTCTQLNVADVSVTKAAGAGTTCSTSNIVYTIGYHNGGPASALAVVVSDVMPAGTSLVSAPAPANWSRTDSVPVGGNGTLMFSRTGASPNGESQTFTVTVSIDGTVTDGTVLSNTASVTSTTPDPNAANNTSSPPTTVTVKKPPTTATVGGPQTICALGTTTALGGNTPTIGTGTWTVQSGGTGTFNPNATTPGATFTHLTGVGPLVLRWTISNPPCPDSFAEVTVTVRQTPTATVGGPQTICALGTTASLGGNTPTPPATGMWSIVTAGVVGTFNPNATTPGATFTHTSGAIGSTATLRWTVSNAPCTDATADVVITIKSQPTATVGGPQTICSGGTTASLGGNTPPAGATGTWSIVTAGVVGTFNPNANTPGATFTHTSGGSPSFVLRWTVANAPCTSATADVTITLQPAPISTNGGPQSVCQNGTTAGLGGNTPAAGETGTWSIVTGGATGTFAPNATTPNATFSPTSGPGTITLRWTVTNATCGASATSDAVITVKQQPTATVGGPQTICALGTTASLGGNTPAGGATGAWSIVTAGSTGTFNPNATTPGATFTHATGVGPITLRWTVSNAPCANATADVVITISQPPTTATVGGPQTICAGSTTASLGGNTPASGTGLWTIQTGGATGTFNPNASTPGATFTPTSGAGVIVVRWTISNPPCTASFAEVTITVKQQPTATVGGPQTICALGTTASLGGNTPTGGATGIWTIVTAGSTGTFNPNASTPGATFTHATGAGPITLRWTVSNPPCSDATADVVITITQPPTTATVGGPQTICALSTTAGLGGNTPASGTGTWTVQSGGAGTFNPNASTPNATFTHTGGAGPIVLRWTIANPPCASSFAEVTITITQSPTTATVGGPQTICALSTTAGLGGNTPASGTGTWTVQSGGAGTFNPNASTPNATFTHTSGAGPIVLRWTIANPPCASSFAEVTITITQPPTTATVGGPQTICALSTTAGLGGNTPASGTGTWTVQSGGAGTFNPNAGTPNATFTHTSGAGPIVLRWTIANAPCPSSFAEVTITITQAPTTATVGGPQTICALSTTAGLGGSTPASGTGTWTVQSGGAGTFNPNASTPNATFTHTSGAGPIVLRWTIANPPCANSFAEVTITITQPPTTATVGGPQTICALSTTAGLGGNTPASGTGTWTVQSGGAGTFNPNANTPNATFTHTSGAGPIVLRWTIANAPCPSSFAEVTITIVQGPTPATVGGPQTICETSATAGLGGNTPSSGTGTWTVQSGGTGTFNPNANTGNATFTSTSGAGTFVLRWTISSPPCPNSFAEVTVTVKQSPTATTSGPQTICALSTTASLGGNTPAGGATGAWSIVGGGTGTFNPNATTPGATFTHTGGTGPITLRWTVSNAPCSNATADVVLTIKQPPTTATVGGNQTIAPGGTTAPLGGNAPASGTGMWTIVTPGATGTFNPNASTPNATWTHATGMGQVKLRWTISNPPCPDSFAEVTIQIGVPPTITCPAPIVVSAPPGQCSASVSFTVTATGIPSPTVTCIRSDTNTTVTSPATFNVGTTTITCTATNGVAPDATCSFTVTVNDTQPPVIVCPANIFIAAAASCPTATGRTVTYTATATDNCPPGTITPVCNPPSGSVFPVGTTTVTCSATDGSGNPSFCSFTVTVFTACMVDESNSGNVVLFNTQTGAYRFCCNGQLLATGTGMPNVRGCGGTIDELKGSRKVHITFDFAANSGNGKGTASLSLNGSTMPTCTVLDQSLVGNVCTCAGPALVVQK